MTRARSHYAFRGPRHNRRGFAVAAVLYLLGLIGLIGGILYSSNMQSVRSVMTVQNSLTVRSDLLAATNTLSAEAVFSADNLTLCPPRSIHETAGDPCAAAPVALVQFADLSATDPHLPANYGAAGSSGSPVEVGVFAAGAGLKQLDPYGHYYIYCRWENPRSSPAAPAFVILSAGSDGNLQTGCGSSTSQGDDGLTTITVGEAINRAALWQSDSSNNVSYGTTGTKVTIDGGGDLNAAGSITAAGSIDAASAAITNGITASTMTATGNVTGGTGSFGDISGSSLEISGAATIGGATTLGVLNAQASTLDSLTVTNNATVGGGMSINGGDIDLANGYSYAQIDSLGVARRLIALSPTNDILLGGHNGTNNIYFLAGNATVGYIDPEGDLDMTGNIAGANGSFGNVTASNTVTAVTGNFTNLTSTNLTATNATVTGTLTAANLSLSGTTIGSSGSFSSLSVINLSASDNITAANADLGAATVSSFMDTSFATISGVTTLNGGAFVSGGLTVNSNASINGELNVNGPAILNNLVGISTDNPQAPLDVYQPSGSYAYIRDSQSGLKISACCGATSIESAGAGMSGAAPLYITDMNGTHTWLSFTSSGVAEFWDSVGIGTANPQSSLDIYNNAAIGAGYAGSIAAPSNGLIVQGRVGIGTSNPQKIFQVHAAANQNIAITGNTTLSSGALLYSMTDNNTAYQPLEIAASQFDLTQGNVGINTASPAAMLDINGYMHLTKYTAAPATCGASLDGDIALSANYTLCICKSGTGWVTTATGSTSCAW